MGNKEADIPMFPLLDACYYVKPEIRLQIFFYYRRYASRSTIKPWAA